MFRSMKEIIGYHLLATDGEIGKCKDFLIQDQLWVVRYMVADTGGWLPGKKTLVSPMSIGEAFWDSERISLGLTKSQVESCPPLDAHAPVSRRYEKRLASHLGYPWYWLGANTWGAAESPGILLAKERQREGAQNEAPEEQGESDDDDIHLRSAQELMKYEARAEGGSTYRVDDMVFEDTSFHVRYLVLGSGGVLNLDNRLVSTEWVRDISYSDKALSLSISKQQLEESPLYDPSAPVNRVLETRLYDYYGRPKYWE